MMRIKSRGDVANANNTGMPKTNINNPIAILSFFISLLKLSKEIITNGCWNGEQSKEADGFRYHRIVPIGHDGNGHKDDG